MAKVATVKSSFMRFPTPKSPRRSEYAAWRQSPHATVDLIVVASHLLRLLTAGFGPSRHLCDAATCPESVNSGTGWSTLDMTRRPNAVLRNRLLSQCNGFSSQHGKCEIWAVAAGLFRARNPIIHGKWRARSQGGSQCSVADSLS